MRRKTKNSVRTRSYRNKKESISDEGDSHTSTIPIDTGRRRSNTSTTNGYNSSTSSSAHGSQNGSHQKDSRGTRMKSNNSSNSNSNKKINGNAKKRLRKSRTLDRNSGNSSVKAKGENNSSFTAGVAIRPRRINTSKQMLVLRPNDLQTVSTLQQRILTLCPKGFLINSSTGITKEDLELLSSNETQTILKTISSDSESGTDSEGDEQDVQKLVATGRAESDQKIQEKDGVKKKVLLHIPIPTFRIIRRNKHEEEEEEEEGEEEGERKKTKRTTSTSPVISPQNTQGNMGDVTTTNASSITSSMCTTSPPLTRRSSRKSSKNSATIPASSTSTPAQAIPSPPTITSNVESKSFVQPHRYIPGLPINMIDVANEYDMTSEDEEWLNEINKERSIPLSEVAFERIYALIQRVSHLKGCHVSITGVQRQNQAILDTSTFIQNIIRTALEKDESVPPKKLHSSTSINGHISDFNNYRNHLNTAIGEVIRHISIHTSIRYPVMTVVVTKPVQDCDIMIVINYWKNKHSEKLKKFSEREDKLMENESKFKRMSKLRQDFERLRILLELITKRERIKTKIMKTHQQELEMMLQISQSSSLIPTSSSSSLSSSTSQERRTPLKRRTRKNLYANNAKRQKIQNEVGKDMEEG